MKKETVNLVIVISLSVLLWLLFGVYTLGYHNGKETVPSISFAYGYDEQKNNWNRIRINERGEVVCSQSKQQ